MSGLEGDFIPSKPSHAQNDLTPCPLYPFCACSAQDGQLTKTAYSSFPFLHGHTPSYSKDLALRLFGLKARTPSPIWLF